MMTMLSQLVYTNSIIVIDVIFDVFLMILFIVILNDYI